MREEVMDDLETNWPVEENAAVDAEEEEIQVAAALSRADKEAAAHQGPAAAYVAGDLAAAAAADPAAAAADVADAAGGPCRRCCYRRCAARVWRPQVRQLAQALVVFTTWQPTNAC